MAYQLTIGRAKIEFDEDNPLAIVTASVVYLILFFLILEVLDYLLGSVHTMRIGVIIGEWNSHKTSTNASLLSYQYSVEM